MAVYTPAQLITPIVMGNGAANIATWRVRDTSNINVHRTTQACSASAARAVTIELGAVAADTAAQKIVDAYVLAANVPTIWNWWQVAKINDYFEGFANNTDIIASSSGYSYA
jgi:hypothetical protein